MVIQKMNYNSLYVHVPFCAKRCDYCAFFVIAKPDHSLRQRYLTRLLQEVQDSKKLFDPMDNIYLGGGTPTHFSLKELQTFLHILTKNIPMSGNCEFTIEGNPTCFTKDKIKLLLDNGVNRFSIGVQSFSSVTRHTIGRAGEIARIGKVVEALQFHSIKNYNLDLIYAVPNQSLKQLRFDLTELITLSPAHISAYSLIIKENTPLAKKNHKYISDDMFVDMWKLVETTLNEECGIFRYEISNFSKPAYECRHNLKIWKGGRFFGLGPSASYFDGTSRWTNPANFNKWTKGNAANEDFLDRPERAIEILLTGLRLCRGWERTEFKLQTGFDYDDLRKREIDRCVSDGLIHREKNHIRLTDRGMLLSDYVERELL